MRREGYVVFRIDINWKTTILPFLLLLVMLIGSNYQIAQERQMNRILIEVLQMEIPRLQRDLVRCRNGYKNVKYRHDRLLGLLPVQEME